MAKVSLNITLDLEVKELLRSVAKKNHMNISQYITYITLTNKELLFRDPIISNLLKENADLKKENANLKEEYFDMKIELDAFKNPF